MEARGAVEVVAFHDVKIGALPGGNELFHPFGVTREGEYLAFELKAQRVRWCPGGMAHLKGRHLHATDGERCLVDKFDEFELVAARQSARTGKQGLGGTDKPLGDAGWSNDAERRRSLADVLGVNEPPHQPGEVVAMQVRDEDGLDRVR